ncbi:MAG TPA: hypothetical protein VKD72_17915 [Gemmataceae bacterium]|nr:hypothetical protein [Gemmataceae bacterium]
MGKKDLQGGWGLLGDIFRETSWPVRLGIFAGLALALAVFVLLLAGGSLDGVRWRGLLVLAVGLLLVGGLGGCLVGVVLEALIPGLRQRDKERRRNKSTSRDRDDRR